MSTALLSDGPQTAEQDAIERFTARGVDVTSQLANWREILATTHLTFEVSPTERTPAKFTGGVTRRAIDDLMLVDCVAAPFKGHRDAATIGAHGPDQCEDILGFQFVYKGVERVREGDREAQLQPGNVALWDGLRPTTIEIMQPFYKRTLLFPRERVLSVCPRLGDLKNMPKIDGNGSARLLVRYMNALAVEYPRLDATAATAAANVALELLRAAVEPELPTGRAAERTALRTDIRRYVREHLHDSDLGPAKIAQAFAMSVRALHALFEDGDASVAVMVRNERLQRCLEDLQQRNGGSITDIAFRWGFCDAAHFSRVFKRKFGATPSEVRHAALAGQPSPAFIAPGT